MDRARKREQWDHTTQILAMIAATGGARVHPDDLHPIKRQERKQRAREGQQSYVVRPSDLDFG